MSASSVISNPTTSRASRITFVAAVVLLITANGLFAILLLNEERRADAKVDRALQVTLVLQAIEDLVTRTGRDQWAFRISGDAARLEAYRQEAAALPGLLAKLRGLDSDKEDEASRKRLAASIENDLHILSETLSPLVTGFQNGMLPQELADSLDRSSAIVSMLDRMQAEEVASLRTQLTTVRLRNGVMLGIVVFGAFAGVVLLVFIVDRLRRETQETKLLAEASYGASQESEQRFRRIFEESPLGIALVRQPNLEVVQANPAFCRMLGYQADQIVGRTITDVTHVDDREMLLRSAMHVDDGSNRGVEVRFVTGAAILAWGHIGLSQMGRSDSRPNLLLALVEDVTREKRVEAELRQAQKMEAVGQLTGGIAHDFNNLLGVIIGNAEFMLDAVQNDTAIVNIAQEILDTALSGADLTRRLLAFASRQTLQPRQINLNAYLPNHVATIRRVLGETIQVSVSLADDLWPTRADPSQVHDALLNLAINARDAMPHGGRIRISTANVHLDTDEQTPDVAQGDYAVLSVADSGIGMAAEVLERAMEPFFTTKGPGAGSGLGLSMIFGFARQSGGHLAIESQPGNGTTVRLYLPRTAEVTLDDDQNRAESTMPLGRESVLLVDDNAEMRAIARQHLISLGYRVREAESGPLAMECLRGSQRFDLLFTDIIMPDGMMGDQLAAGARQMQPGLKVLFTTGYARPAVTTDEHEEPSGPVLRKPYRKQDLAMAVRAALDS